jgi:hypothetical protein
VTNPARLRHFITTLNDHGNLHDRCSIGLPRHRVAKEPGRVLESVYEHKPTDKPKLKSPLGSIEMAPSVTWNLDRTGSTANELFGVGKAIFQTAYRDNIQPFALHACEKFGGTIAMSAKTRQRLTQEVCTPVQPEH